MNNSQRIHWKIGQVNDIIRGNFGLIHSAHIRMKNGDTTKPIVKLYPLEIYDINDNSRQNSEGRPRRQASEKARQLIKRCCQP